IAGGANVICFTNGRGKPYGCKPAPSIKLATNTPMYVKLEEDMDINCGRILDGAVSLQQMGEEIFQSILDTCSGRKTKSELFGLGDHEFVPWQMGITG
ncbi:MAG: UxaA family hydrolase, partial [Gemmatimonadetes bacterium]|nr:UxaA family hydrolase [Gemmatimonadota bacterium]